MSAIPPESALIVSPRIYALILGSPRLKSLLLPEGLICSPYTVLDYDMTLTLEDEKGREAVLRRRQRIQFHQDGVGAILDHFWGDGIVAGYRTSAGQVIDSFKDGHRRHLLIRLTRPMGRGEILEFTVERRVMEAFDGPDGWEETTIDHPIQGLGRTIRFPKGRPAQTARLECRGQETPLHILETRSGATEIALRIPQARTDTPYIIRWTW